MRNQVLVRTSCDHGSYRAVIVGNPKLNRSATWARNADHMVLLLAEKCYGARASVRKATNEEIKAAPPARSTNPITHVIEY